MQEAGKNIKPLKTQKQFAKIKKPKQINEELALDFIGFFAAAPENRKYILVAIVHFSAYPTLEFVKGTYIKGVEKFLRKYGGFNTVGENVLKQEVFKFF